MPSEDFQRMSDEELSDIVAYIRSQPPVDNLVPPVSLGPLGKVLVATGQLPLSADRIPSHDAPHALLPPTAEASAEFGAHLAGICAGCHGEDLSGGPIPGAPPNWVPARNLTPHADGLAGWTYDQFTRAMREGVRPDGSPLQEPMTLITPYALNMTEVELQALWAYLQSVPAVPSTSE
jgi:mono/diheme cytochrome c family protein